MKVIGLIGGMSWESTREYYRKINILVNSRLGGSHSAEMILYSVDFGPVEDLQMKGGWERLTEYMVRVSRSLEKGGAELLAIGTNTMHLMADDVAGAVDIPLVHIADATGDEIVGKGLSRVGLMGTRFTMEQEFYRKRIQDNFGIDVIIPEEEERNEIHRIIYTELCCGIFSDVSKGVLLDVISNLRERGAGGIILGCTELPLLVKQEDVEPELFDTMDIHTERIVSLSLEG